MPTSLTPPPKDDETECGNCGAYVYQELLKCPNCGVYLIDPVDTEPEKRPGVRPKSIEPPTSFHASICRRVSPEATACARPR